MTQSIARRTVLKGLGVAVGTAALGTYRPQPTEARRPAREDACYVYLAHGASNLGLADQWSSRGQWVVSALLVRDPRLPRQLIRRAKRHRLSADQRATPEILAREASDDFREYFYKLLASRGDGRLEAYSIRVSQKFLQSKGDEVGLFQLRAIQNLLTTCDLWRFQKVSVYQNVPSLKGLSGKALRTAIEGTALPKETRLRVWEHDSARDQGSPQNGYPQILANDALQAAGLVSYAFYQKYRHGNRRFAELIAPIVRRELDARRLRWGSPR